MRYGANMQDFPINTLKRHFQNFRHYATYKRVLKELVYNYCTPNQRRFHWSKQMSLNCV